MSEHTIDQHDIELPELPKDEDERRLDEIAEVIHDFLGTKESESLEAQSATYSQEEQVIDRRIESQERVQALENGLEHHHATTDAHRAAAGPHGATPQRNVGQPPPPATRPNTSSAPRLPAAS